MTSAKTIDLDYIHYLMSECYIFSCCEAERCSKFMLNSPYHDSFRRLLEERIPQNTEALWIDVAPLVSLNGGFLVIDDSTLDKPHARVMDLTAHHWSGNHHKVVQGISLVTLVWTNGCETYPIDFRIYHKDSDSKSKNDHFYDMMIVAKERGFQPDCVLFDSWYGSVENLRLLRRLGWHFLTRLKKNRNVNRDKLKNIRIENLDIPYGGLDVHLKNYGMVRVFHRDDDGNGIQFWATDILSMTENLRTEYSGNAIRIEEYHRNLKQYCGVESCQSRSAKSQRSHIYLAIRAFVRMENRRWADRISIFEQKKEGLRKAVFLKMKGLRGQELKKNSFESNTA